MNRRTNPTPPKVRSTGNSIAERADLTMTWTTLGQQPTPTTLAVVKALFPQGQTASSSRTVTR